MLSSHTERLKELSNQVKDQLRKVTRMVSTAVASLLEDGHGRAGDDFDISLIAPIKADSTWQPANRIPALAEKQIDDRRLEVFRGRSRNSARTRYIELLPQ